MEMRRLGRTGLSIAPLVFGGNVFGWTADEKTSFSLLDAFFDAGFNAVDTADVYSSWAPGNRGGESEAIIGKWLKQSGRSRDSAVIVTKVGSELGPDRKGLSRRWIMQAVEDSLRRLQTDYIDLYLSHWPDPDIPYDETLAAYDTLLSQGKLGRSAHRISTRSRWRCSRRCGGEGSAPLRRAAARIQSLRPRFL